MSRERWINRPSGKVIEKMAADAMEVSGGVDLGRSLEGFLKTGTSRRGFLRAAVVTGLIFGGVGCSSKETETSVATPSSPEPTQVKPTDIPSSPSITFEKPTSEPTPTEVPTPSLSPTPEPTPTIELRPTPTAVIEMGLSEMAIGGESDILEMFDIVRLAVNKGNVEAKNPGVKLLVPEGTREQFFVQLQKYGQTWILANWNLPVYPETAQFQPTFNTTDFIQMMGWVDNEGNWFYHVPLQAGEEGKAPVVFMEGGRLFEGLVDLNINGLLDQESIKPFWQLMPEKAVKAVMAKYENAVFVTFYDKEAQPLLLTAEEQEQIIKENPKAVLEELEDDKGNKWTAIKVCDLPVEPTPVPPTPTPTETPEPTPTNTETPVSPTKTPTKKPTPRPTETQKPPENIISRGSLTIENNSSIIKVVFNPDFSKEEIQEFLDALKIGGNTSIKFRLVPPEQVPKYGPPGTGCYGYGPAGHCQFAEYPEPGKVTWIMGPHGDWLGREGFSGDWGVTVWVAVASFTHNFEEFINSGGIPEAVKPLMRKYYDARRAPLKVVVP